MAQEIGLRDYSTKPLPGQMEAAFWVFGAILNSLDKERHDEVNQKARTNDMARTQWACTDGVEVAQVFYTQGVEVVLVPIFKRKSGHHRGLASTLRT
jgi:hypothetical protein